MKLFFIFTNAISLDLITQKIPQIHFLNNVILKSIIYYRNDLLFLISIQSSGRETGLKPTFP